DVAQRTGATLEDRYGHLVRRIESMHAGRASAIESRLARVTGVLEAVVAPDGTLRVEYDRQVTNEGRVNAALQEWSQPAGPKADDHIGHEHAHGAVWGPRSELIFALICGGL